MTPTQAIWGRSRLKAPFKTPRHLDTSLPRQIWRFICRYVLTLYCKDLLRKAINYLKLLLIIFQTSRIVCMWDILHWISKHASDLTLCHLSCGTENLDQSETEAHWNCTWRVSRWCDLDLVQIKKQFQRQNGPRHWVRNQWKPNFSNEIWTKFQLPVFNQSSASKYWWNISFNNLTKLQYQ